MIDYNFVPETLEWCQEHYVPPVDKYITCEDFGHSDPMNGSCYWCLEMCPYEFEMCRDESWVRSLLSSASRNHFKTKEEAAEFIEAYKQRKFGEK